MKHAPEPDKRYQLGPLEADQVRVLVDALDLYARVLLGQLDEVVNLARMGLLTDGEGHPASAARIREAESRLNEVKQLLTGFAPNASKGICARHTPSAAKHAFLLRKVMRYRMALERKPDGSAFDGVDFDDPYLVQYLPGAPRTWLSQYRPPADEPEETKARTGR